MSEKPCLLIINLTHGTFDGVYFDDAMARGALAHWREAFPSDRVILTSILDVDRPGVEIIPDARFMAEQPAAPLSAVIAQHVELERRTPDRLLGLCPFHEEQTPSFMVDDAIGRFHCLGCGARGDAVDFAAKMGRQ